MKSPWAFFFFHGVRVYTDTHTAVRALHFLGRGVFRSPSPFKGRPVVSYPDMWPGPIRKPRLPGVSVFHQPQWIFCVWTRQARRWKAIKQRSARTRAVRLGERKIPGFKRSIARSCWSWTVGTKSRIYVVVYTFLYINVNEYNGIYKSQICASG